MPPRDFVFWAKFPWGHAIKDSIKIVKEGKPTIFCFFLFLHCAQCFTYPSPFSFLFPSSSTILLFSLLSFFYSLLHNLIFPPCILKKIQAWLDPLGRQPGAQSVTEKQFLLKTDQGEFEKLCSLDILGLKLKIQGQ